MNISEQRILLWALMGIALVLGGITLRLHHRVGDLETQISRLEQSGINQLSITVIGLDPAQGRVGQYFQFDAKQLDAALGRDQWVGSVFIAAIPDRGFVEPVRLWAKQGERHMGIGRTQDDLPGFDWRVGDELLILVAP